MLHGFCGRQGSGSHPQLVLLGLLAAIPTVLPDRSLSKDRKVKVQTTLVASPRDIKNLSPSLRRRRSHFIAQITRPAPQVSAGVDVALSVVGHSPGKALERHGTIECPTFA